jgi:putative ABC transport system permease protein
MWLEDLRQDVGYGWRLLCKTPGFTLVVVLTLALGIGANTAIFSFFHSVLLRPLPLTDPDHVVIFQPAPGRTGHIKAEGVGLLSGDYLDIKKNSRTLSDAATYILDALTLTGVDTPDMINCVSVTPNFFTVLGAKAALGRVFTPEDLRDGSRLAVLNHGYWRSMFGGNPDVIGKQVTLDGVNFTVVGVMPPDYDFPLLAKFYLSCAGPTPEGMPGNEREFTGRGRRMRTIIGRLQPGVTIQQAEAELGTLVRNLPNPAELKRPVYLVTMRDQIVGSVRAALRVLFGCVGLVLLLACLNVANLVLARANSRQRETGIRLALGASRSRLVRQTLTESVLVALLGGALGVGFGVLGLRALVAMAPPDLPRLATVGIDGWVLAFAFGVSVLTGVGFGLAPALELTSVDLSRTLNEASRGGSTGIERRRLRSILVGGEVAISLVLLVAAGLLLRSFWQMQAVSWGIDAQQVVSMRIGFPASHNTDYRAAHRTLIDKLEHEPGFEAVGMSFDRIGVSWWQGAFAPDTQAFAKPEDMPKCSFHTANPQYFRALRIPVLKGRAFTDDDNEKGRAVAIVDANVARTWFPGVEAVGRKIKFPRGNSDAEIVGVVGAVKSNGPEAAPGFDIYFPLLQVPQNNAFALIRTRLPAGTATAAVRRIVRSIDPAWPVADIATMETVEDRAAVGRRFPLLIICAFAGLALTLAAIGIYAVTSFAVAQRTREIGIRIALGSEPRAVVALLMRQGGVPIAAGLAIGLAGGTALAFAMRTLLFGIPPVDLATFAVVPLFLTAVAAVACWLPSRRAAQVDPIITLRAE